MAIYCNTDGAVIASSSFRTQEAFKLAILRDSFAHSTAYGASTVVALIDEKIERLETPPAPPPTPKQDGRVISFLKKVGF